MTSYDALPYPGFPYRQTHPDRLRTIARLLGLDAAPAERCRVLELGCGDGGNLLPMAIGLPASEFVGIDLGEEHIRRGQEAARELRLSNLTLRRLDLLELGPDFGEFDYIIAYGLYSWVPAPVAGRILEIAARHLAPLGVAYVNYTAYPGSRLREALRDMMLYAARDVEEPAERIRRARELLEELAGSPFLSDEYGAFVKAEASRLLAREAPFLFHDELAEIYRPVYFHEFIEQAAAHGFQYLAEATLSDTHTAPSAGGSLVEREQHLDFLKGRAFRHTLLCRAGLELEHGLEIELMPTLFAACAATMTESEGMLEFRSSRGGLKTAHPLAKAVLSRLVEAWPGTLAVSRLNAEIGEERAASVARILLSAFAGGVIELYSTPPPIAAVPGERPRVTALARLQTRRGETITTLLHGYITVTDPLARRLITLLDGTRDRAALLAELSAPADELEASLTALARLGVLLRD